jgi:hypothetical protein
LIRFTIRLVGFGKGAEFAGDLFHIQSVPSERDDWQEILAMAA